MLSKEQLKQYEEEGYVIFEDLFSDAEIDALTARIDKFDQESERLLKEGKKIGKDDISRGGQINFSTNLNLADPEIQKFACQDKFVQITTELLGPDIRLYWDQSVYKRPEADKDFPWHQDNGYVPTDPEHFVTCWLALEDATIENGCIWVQPRTHLNGLVEHKWTETGYQCYFEDDPGVAVPLKKGSMVAFNSLLFHRSAPNRSNATRKGYIIQYSEVGAKNAETGEEFNNGPIIARNGESVYEPENIG